MSGENKNRVTSGEVKLSNNSQAAQKRADISPKIAVAGTTGIATRAPWNLLSRQMPLLGERPQLTDAEPERDSPRQGCGVATGLGEASYPRPQNGP